MGSNRGVAGRRRSRAIGVPLLPQPLPQILGRHYPVAAVGRPLISRERARLIIGPKATWTDADRHLLGWREPVIDQTEELEALLSTISRGCRRAWRLAGERRAQWRADS